VQSGTRKVKTEVKKRAILFGIQRKMSIFADAKGKSDERERVK